MSTTQTPRPFYKFPKSLSAEESHSPTNGFETSPSVNNNNSNEKINKEQLIPKRSAPPPPKVAQKVVQMSASGLNGSITSGKDNQRRGPKKPNSLGPPPKPSRSVTDPVLARSPSAGSGQKQGFLSETPTSPKYSASGYSSLKGAPAINVHGEPIQPSPNEKDGNTKPLKFFGNFYSGKYCFFFVFFS